MRAGGGANHRFGLDDAALIKDNHVAIAGSASPRRSAASRAHVGHLVKIEVEVDTLAQLEEALARRRRRGAARQHVARRSAARRRDDRRPGDQRGLRPRDAGDRARRSPRPASISSPSAGSPTARRSSTSASMPRDRRFESTRSALLAMTTTVITYLKSQRGLLLQLCWGRWRDRAAKDARLSTGYGAGWGVGRAATLDRIARASTRTFNEPSLLSAPHPALRATFPASRRRRRATARNPKKCVDPAATTTGVELIFVAP